MPENTDHPTQKPEKLVAKLILASSRPYDFVFDPFLGSGTTAVVAKKLGRRFCGVELDRDYCCWALKRLKLAETDPGIQGYSEGVFGRETVSPIRSRTSSETPGRRIRRGFSMNDALQKLMVLIKANDGINDKARLARVVSEAFGLTKDRSVYYCANFAIRFSSSARASFGNTILSLSNLRKHDDRPFIVCLVTSAENHCLLANTTLLKKSVTARSSSRE